jgi:glycosyltransferase involved in cell wall biosynthesis
VVDPADSVPATAGGLLSIVVPCIDEHEELERFLRSVAERLPETEVVVVSMGGWEPSPDLRERLVLRPVASELLSIAAAKNLGLRHATRPYVALMDSDNVLLGPAREWDAALAEALARRPDLVCLGRREASRRLADGVTPTKWNFSRHTIGWSVVWRRDHLERIGGFDERFGTGTVAGCGEDFGPLYEHFADPGATTASLPQLGVGHPSLQKPVTATRLYRYTYGSAASTVLPLRHRPSPLAAYWSAKTVAGFAADLARGLRRRDRTWTRVVLRARARAVADAAVLGAPRRLSETARRAEERP